MTTVEQIELLESGECTIERGGRRSLQRTMIVTEPLPTKAVKLGPPYGTLNLEVGGYLKTKRAIPIDDKHCRLVLTYESSDPIANPQLDQVTWETDIGTQNVRVYETEDQVSYTVDPVWQGVLTINEDDEGNIEGVDIMVPRMELTARVRRKRKFWSLEYQAAVFDLCARINDAKFQGLAAKTVLFLGCQKQDEGEDYVSLVYKFAYSAGKKANPMTYLGESGPATVNVPYEGWDYVWSRNGKKYANNHELKGRISIHVAKGLYETGDFSTLKLAEDDSEITDDTPYGIL